MELQPGDHGKRGEREEEFQATRPRGVPLRLVHSNVNVQHGGFHDGIDGVVTRASGHRASRMGRVGRPAITVLFASRARSALWGWQPTRARLPLHLEAAQQSLEELVARFVGKSGKRSKSQRLAE